MEFPWLLAKLLGLVYNLGSSQVDYLSFLWLDHIQLVLHRHQVELLLLPSIAVSASLLSKPVVKLLHAKVVIVAG